MTILEELIYSIKEYEAESKRYSVDIDKLIEVIQNEYMPKEKELIYDLEEAISLLKTTTEYEVLDSFKKHVSELEKSIIK